jgi:hypothetical protein
VGHYVLLTWVALEKRTGVRRSGRQAVTSLFCHSNAFFQNKSGG